MLLILESLVTFDVHFINSLARDNAPLRIPAGGHTEGRPMNPTFAQEKSQRRGTLRPLLSDTAVIALCMVVTLMEGYNLIVFGSVVPLLLQDQSLQINQATAGLVGGIAYAGALIGVLGGTA